MWTFNLLKVYCLNKSLQNTIILLNINKFNILWTLHTIENKLHNTLRNCNRMSNIIISANYKWKHIEVLLLLTHLWIDLSFSSSFARLRYIYSNKIYATHFMRWQCWYLFKRKLCIWEHVCVVIEYHHATYFSDGLAYIFYHHCFPNCLFAFINN